MFVLLRALAVLHLSQKLRLQVNRAFKYLKKPLRRKILQGRCDDRSRGVQSSDDLQSCLYGLCRSYICTAHNNRSGELNLVVEELAEVSCIKLCLLRIHYGDCGIALDSQLLLYSGYSLHYIRQLAYAAGLYDDSVRLVGGQYLLERCREVSDQRAAYAALAHLLDLYAGILQEASVYADLAELVLYQHYLLILDGSFQHHLDECCFSCPEKSRDDVNLCFCHDSHLSFLSRN